MPLVVTPSDARSAIRETHQYLNTIEGAARQIVARRRERGEALTGAEQAWFARWIQLTEEFDRWIPDRVGLSDPKAIYDAALDFRRRAEVLAHELRALGAELPPLPSIPKPGTGFFDSLSSALSGAGLIVIGLLAWQAMRKD